MPFSVPEPKSADNANRFEFTLPGDDQVWSVPLLKYLPLELAERLMVARGTRAFLPLFGDHRAALGKKVRTLSLDQIDALVKAWGDASGVTVGESGASSDS